MKSVTYGCKALVNFSLGRESYFATMEKLGLDSEEDLFLLMAKFHLPMPRLPEGKTQKVVDDLSDLLS